MVVNSNDPRDAYSYTWTAVGTNFMNTDAYGTLKFSRDLPFAPRMNISPIKYGEPGAAIDIDYTVKNPSKSSITAQTSAQKDFHPGRGNKIVFRKNHPPFDAERDCHVQGQWNFKLSPPGCK